MRLKIGDGLLRHEGREEEAWPLERTGYQQLKLEAGSKAFTAKAVETESTGSHDPKDEAEHIVFDDLFSKETQLIGNAKLELSVDADGWVLPCRTRWFRPHGEPVPRVRCPGRCLCSGRQVEAELA